MIRVLQVYPVMNNAGTENVILNWYKNIDKKKVQFDFLVQNKGCLDQEILKMGGKIHYLPKCNKGNYKKELVKFFDNNKQYNIVHTHTHSEMDCVLRVCKKKGIKCRIAHSHSSRRSSNKILNFLKKIKSLPIKNNATDFWACSEDAARWLFPFRDINYKVIKNGINIQKFRYSEKDRNEIREEFFIKKFEKVICHIGRFSKEKNHSLVVDICNEVIKTNSNVKILLVGIGPLEEEIEKKVNQLGIYDKILFLKNRFDVNKIMSASDILLFPSINEGLGLVAIEAQANGLTCVVSKSIPKEADLNLGLYKSYDLKSDLTEWTHAINKIQCDLKKRKINGNIIKKAGYEIESVSDEILKFYLAHN